MTDYYRKPKLMRRSRVFRISLDLWRPRLVFWIGAIAIGVISVLFARAADYAQKTFAFVTSSPGAAHLLPILVTPLGFVLSAWLCMTLFPNAQGSGIPQAIAARHLHEDDDRSKLLSIRLRSARLL